MQTINYHLKEIFKSGELEEDSVIQKIRITAQGGKKYLTNFYNLDAIIAVGYRVNSYQATQFRIWATQVLREYLVKGFVMDGKTTSLAQIRLLAETCRQTQKRLLETARAIASPLKKCPYNLDILTFCTYICNNSTRHASRQISVPGRVFYF